MDGYFTQHGEGTNGGKRPTGVAANHRFDESNSRHYPHMILDAFSAFSENFAYAVRWLSLDQTNYLQSPISLVRALISSTLPRGLRESSKQLKRAHDTSYLDALRGWAAVIVWISHTFPYKNTWIFQLPFTKALVHGRSMTMVFFVISGYALSYRMLKLMRKHQAQGLLDAFVSSIFRRQIRLFGSTGIATFVAMLLVWFGFDIPTLREEPLLQQTFLLQLKDWFLDFARLSNPLNQHIDGYFHPLELQSFYLGVTWTIPIELRGSILLFIFCIGTCKLSNRNRMALCWMFIICSYLYQVAYVSMFLGGLFIADLAFSQHPERLNQPSRLGVEHGITIDRGGDIPQCRRIQVFYAVVLAIAIFLLGQPAGDLSLHYWPWPILDGLIPPIFDGPRTRELWYMSVGSFLLVWALDASPLLQAPLKWNFSKYLGELSFGIYITHHIVLWTIHKCVLVPLQISLLGTSFWSFAPVVPIHFMFLLWVAELFTRVDQKVITFAKWCETRFFVW